MGVWEAVLREGEGRGSVCGFLNECWRRGVESVEFCKGEKCCEIFDEGVTRDRLAAIAQLVERLTSTGKE